ncbi:MAG: NAD(P)H-dependent oxidoreductase [Actinomycetaceae bacterium]|nr:NAD(P)H-dependent oxidoreductase [Actinomycetaceae bacterium]
MAKILMINGSLRKNSFNGQVAKTIADIIGQRAEVSFLDWSNVPVYNQDNDYPAVEAVEKVRHEAQAADALWFVTPEYNLQIPGPLKNLTDWLSRSLDPANPRGASAVDGKVTTVSAASADGGTHVRAHMEDLLSFIRTDVVKSEQGVAINPEAWMTGELQIDDATREALSRQVDALLAKIS